MIKNNKGITLIALVVTVIVLIILVSIGTNSGLDTVKSSRYYEAISELKIMQTKVNEIYEECRNAQTDEEKNAIIEKYGESVKISSKSSEIVKAYSAVKAKNIAGEEIGEASDYRYFSKDYIKDTLDLDGIKYDFAVNIKTRTVILIDGFEKDEETYYALCQIEGELYNVNYENN